LNVQRSRLSIATQQCRRLATSHAKGEIAQS
jgi:hypothetical protein